ncbi:ATP-binding protein [Photobacterium alginatilyticum]|uniref:DNA biosynthesis protein n=1 Tax=Photobacterium alginatilyticum TaxID=1775171 RepID=A0ABW9YLE6_9GAMM|nr:ATP-binding protein [Photobacterium alginatilyticum]NBI54674.1 DNA biosynthesis protein [Photobacterium alginatilyticum]
MNIMDRLSKALPTAMPKHIQPYTAEQMAEIRERESMDYRRQLDEENRQVLAAKAIGRSGIKKRHQGCKFDNYFTHYEGQRLAYAESRTLLDDYINRRSAGGFIFAGTSGTGKNHLACAIANGLLQLRRSVVVITVAELMLKIRDSYRKDAEISETEIIRYLSSVELLVIDELGVQHNSNNERVMINRIIDERYTQERPTGIITNLESDDLVKTLGRAAIDRIMEDGKWVTFNWESFRRKGRAA